MTGPVSGATSVQQTVDIQGMDLETAMMAVQSNRANLLEDQLKSQMDQVQKKNAQIAKLNSLMSSLNGALAEQKSGTKNEDPVKMSPDSKAAVEQACKDMDMEVPPVLVSTEGQWEVTLQDGSKIPVDSAGKAEAEDYKSKNWAFRSDNYDGSKGITDIKQTQEEHYPTKGEIDKFVTDLKGQIDALSNSQQMDMLRLQSLSNKRNEAFDLMSNFIKKMQDNRSSIIGNMR